MWRTSGVTARPDRDGIQALLDSEMGCPGYPRVTVQWERAEPGHFVTVPVMHGRSPRPRAGGRIDKKGLTGWRAGTWDGLYHPRASMEVPR